MANVYVRASGSTFELIEGDAVTASFGTLRLALDAALEKVATKEKRRFLRDPDTGDENGVFRWLPATEEEPDAIKGVRIDAVAIAEMADSLNARTTPIAVDGGPTPEGLMASEVHGTAHTGGATLANGWAHWAVLVESNDSTELYLWAELVPSVAREIDAGRMALGSVHFGFETLEGELPRGCVLISHALTNDPAVTTLAPANSIRTDGLSARRTKAIAGRVLRSNPAQQREEKRMSEKKTVRAMLEHGFGLRGAALDKFSEVCASMGVDVNDELDGDMFASKLSDAIHALKLAAQAEKVIEGGAGTGASDAVEASRSGGEGERAMDLGAKLREMLGLAADASDDDVIAALEAKMGEGDGEDEAAASADEASKEVEKARATTESLRTQLAAMQAQVKALEPLRLEKEKRDREDAVDAAMAKRGMSDRSSRDRFVTLAARHGVSLAIEAIEAAHVPPGTAVMTSSAGEAARSSVAPEGSPVIGPEDALEVARRKVCAENPTLSGAALHSAVYARARKDHPEAFRRQAAN